MQLSIYVLGALLASYPGLPTQLFLQPWKMRFFPATVEKHTHFSTAVKKAARGDLGTDSSALYQSRAR